MAIPYQKLRKRCRWAKSGALIGFSFTVRTAIPEGLVAGVLIDTLKKSVGPDPIAFVSEPQLTESNGSGDLLGIITL